jgi:hypothetical protein
MTPDYLILLARKSGFLQHIGVIAIPNLENLKRFAEMVASDEREACEKICVEEFDAENPYIGQGKACAAAIRARGEK